VTPGAQQGRRIRSQTTLPRPRLQGEARGPGPAGAEPRRPGRPTPTRSAASRSSKRWDWTAQLAALPWAGERVVCRHQAAVCHPGRRRRGAPHGGVRVSCRAGCRHPAGRM